MKFYHDLNFQAYKGVGRGQGNKSAPKRCKKQKRLFRYRSFHTHLFADIFYRSLFWGHSIFLFHCLQTNKQTKGFNTHRLGCCVKYLFNKGLLVNFRWQQKPRIVCNIYSWRKNNLQWPVNDWLFKNTKKTKLFRVVLGNFKRLSGDCPQTPP